MSKTDEDPRTKFPADLEPQSFPDSKNTFLRYQLGQFVFENRQVLVQSTGGHVIEHTFPVRLFHLIGFGSTWEAATKMALERLGLVSRAPVMPDPQLADFFGPILTG